MCVRFFATLFKIGLCMYSLKNQRYLNCCCLLSGFVGEMRLKRSFFYNSLVTYCVFIFCCFALLRGVVLLFLSLTVYAISALINPNIFPFSAFLINYLFSMFLSVFVLCV